MNAVLFLLIGLQLRVVEDDPGQRSASTLLFDALILNCVIFAVRFVWVYGRGYAMRLFGRKENPRFLAVIAWSGMRGSVSLAAALSIPYFTVAGASFPDRHFVLYMTFSVVVVTLVGQGLTLSPLVKYLGLTQTGVDEEEVAALRELGNRGVLAIDQLAGSGISPQTVGVLHNRFDRLRGAFAEPAAESFDNIERESEMRAASLLVIAAQREALDEMSRCGRIDFSTQKKIQRLLDLQEAETVQVQLALAPRLAELEARRVTV